MWHHLVKNGDKLYQDGKEVSQFKIEGIVLDFTEDVLWLKVSSKIDLRKEEH